jgi:phosphoribosylamine---glycine ligase
MHVLIVGGGGREHALCHAISSSPRLTRLSCAPGNAGTARLAENVPIPATDRRALLTFCEREGVDLCVIGPEGPLVAGLAEDMEADGILVVGPSAAAARLEGSKTFAKAFMERHDIPTAGYRSFGRSEREEAEAYLAACRYPVVLKADGLASGKGVTIAQTRAEAELALAAMFDDDVFGRSGHRVVIEDFMEGEEASVFAITDGRDYVVLPPAQDHKRIGEGDVGPNTGGMGAYAPAPIISPDLMREVEDRVIRPTIRGMAEEGYPYKGILYCGLMITPDGPMVIEYNCRFGDPEAQVLLPLIENDVLDLFEAVAHAHVRRVELRHRGGAAACVVLASEGYPAEPVTGRPVNGLGAVPDGLLVYHASTAVDDEGRVVTSGGRVLSVTGVAGDLRTALQRAYDGVDRIAFDGMQVRRDIGHRGLARLAGDGS